MLLPSEATLSSVSRWLKDGGVTNVNVDADWINIQTTVRVANDLLDTEFAWYSSEEFGKRLRTLEYSVPDDVLTHINTIQPTIRFGQGLPAHETHQAIEQSEIIDDAALANGTDCVCIFRLIVSYHEANMSRTLASLHNASRTCTRLIIRPMPRVAPKLPLRATSRNLRVIPISGYSLRTSLLMLRVRTTLSSRSIVPPTTKHHQTHPARPTWMDNTL